MSKYLDGQGYIRIYDPSNPCSDSKGYIYEHRKKMSEKLQREEPNHPALDSLNCIRPNWTIHHEDEDKSNNADDNLELQRDFRHKQHHFTVNNPHPTERDDLGRFV